MAILFSNEIYAAICRELRTAEQSVRILTAYGKTNAIAALMNEVKSTVSEKKIMFRFRLDDLVKDATDFAVLDLCRNGGWEVYLRFDLHAKTYLVDHLRGIVGSANATGAGLSLGAAPNFEMAALVEVEARDVEKIDDLFSEALRVDDALRVQLYAEYAETRSRPDSAPCRWSKAITDRFHPKIRTLFSHEFPEKSSYCAGEPVPFLETVYSGDVSSLRESLRWSSVYLWLLEQLAEKGDALYFGELSARLHRALVNDPAPHRKDVKTLLANLLQLIVALDMPEIGVDRPNHSQRVFRKPGS